MSRDQVEWERDRFDLDAARRCLVALVEKYRLLADLSAGVPGRTLERRDAIRAIAERFPGAMREWDEISPSELIRRRRVVEHLLARCDRGDGGAVLDEVRSVEGRWIRIMAALHERLRRSLTIKRWIAGRCPDEEIVEEVRARFGVDREELHRIAHPRAGRFSDEVYRTLAANHGLSVEEIKAMLFCRAW